jgi:glycosyltransferase involved in cell wall biosynthesis
MGCGTVATIHGSRFDDYCAGHEKTVSKVLSAASRILVLTSSAHDRVTKLGLGHRCVVLNNAVEVARTVHPPEVVTPTVLFAGEVGLRKGVDVLVKAWPLVVRHVPSARLVVAGPVAKGQSAVYQAALTTANAELLGAVSQGMIRDLLARSTLAVLPSRAEAMPKFLLEAMAAGRPVVATSVGAVHELIDDSVGRIVPPGNAEVLANILVELLTKPDLCVDLGNNAHQKAYLQYRIESHMKTLAEIYVGVLEESDKTAVAL